MQKELDTPHIPEAELELEEKAAPKKAKFAMLGYQSRMTNLTSVFHKI